MKGKKLFAIIVLFSASFLFIACDKNTTDVITNDRQTTKLLTDTQATNSTAQSSNETTQSIKEDILTEPTVEIVDVTTTDRSIYFGLQIVDSDAISNIVSIQLRDSEGTITNLIDIYDLKFTSLLEDTTYTIVVKYNYNINDGLGLIHKTIEYETKTKAFVQPNIQVDTSYIGSDILQFEVSFEEPIPFKIAQAEIYNQVTLVQKIDNYRKTSITFFDLEPNTRYHVLLYITYDLQDGEGERSFLYDTNERTDNSSIIEIEVLNTTQSTILFDIIYNDLPSTGEIKEVSLLLAETDEVIYTLEDLDTLAFTGLNPDTEYVIYLMYENDDNDTTPSVQKIQIWYTVKTLPNVSE